MPFVGREAAWKLLHGASAFLENRSDPMDIMVNHVLEADAAGNVTLFALPKPARDVKDRL